MKLLEKRGNELFILGMPSEMIYLGDYLGIEDEEQGKVMVVQVYDESYLESPSLVDDIVREEILRSSAKGVEHDPLEIHVISYTIRDLRVLRCKIRGTAANGMLTNDASWIPSRVRSLVRKMTVEELLSLAKRDGLREILIGSTHSSEPFKIHAESIDGRLNIIAGRKDSGKSHLAKILVSKLVEFSAYSIVFDLNDEYSGIARLRNGRPSEIAGRVIRLEPGASLRFSLRYLGLHPIFSMLQHSLDMPAISLREFSKIWEYLQSRNLLTMNSLQDAINGWRCNELVREALYSRYQTMASSHIFTDDEVGEVVLEDIFSSHRDGCVLTVPLNKSSTVVRRMVVDLILAKLLELLAAGKIRPVFLFAEEAHLYLRDTYWDDVVTRMRHFGIFTTFITNQPDAIRNSIYRQADNFFLCNFTNDSDLETVSQSSVTDFETIKSIVRTLPPRSCLLLGTMVNNLPTVVKVVPSELMTLGETKLFFPLKTIETEAHVM